MISGTRKLVLLVAVCLALAIPASSTATSTQNTLPNPVLVFLGQEFFETGGKPFIRYRYVVDNLTVYPKELFAPAPSLPPCGLNTKASRTWVDIYEQNGKRLNRFCVLGNPSELDKLWFALDVDVIPPSWVYIEMTDRQTGTKYKSNLAESTL